jgi:hypothetical protein
MKNVHVLPTDKPSRLRYFDSKLEIMSLIPKKSDIVFQHIYITNNEEIKEGDWFYVKTPDIYGGNIIAKSLGNSNGCWADNILTETTDEKGYHPSHCVKIILTTDTDLIKDGVQAIDDDFLQWFVRNSTCESVDVKTSGGRYSYDMGGNIWIPITYKIIIPQEEPKCLYDTPKSCENSQCRVQNKCNGDRVKPKQETLEEAAEDNAKKVGHYAGYQDFISGAKWQAERMYSEEEVKQIAEEVRWQAIGNPLEFTKNFNKWFEQHKKK